MGKEIFPKWDFTRLRLHLMESNTTYTMAFITDKGGIIFPRLSVVRLPLLCARCTKSILL